MVDISEVTRDASKDDPENLKRFARLARNKRGEITKSNLILECTRIER